MLYLLLYYTYYLSSLGIISPAYNTLKLLYYIYSLYSHKKKKRVTIIKEEYNKEEDVVVLEMTELSN
jgi:hypothetical protein